MLGDEEGCGTGTEGGNTSVRVAGLFALTTPTSAVLGGDLFSFLEASRAMQSSILNPLVLVGWGKGTEVSPTP